MPPKEVTKIAVFGAGTMGSGLAQVFALAGYEVAMYSRRAETLERAMTMVETGLGTLAEYGRITQEEAGATKARIFPTQNLAEAASEAQFALETIAEDKQAKSELYRELNQLLPAESVLASNTSSLNIFDLVPESRQEHTIIAHFFTPAYIIPLVEVVPGPKTDPETVAFTIRLMEACGKSPVVMKKFGPGFIVNRIQRAIGETAMDMIEEGLVEPQDIDRAIKLSLGIRLPIVGVVQTFDFQGLDMLLAYQKNVGKVYRFVEERVERGELGAKTSRGIYDYQGRSEAEIVRKRDLLYLQMLDHLTRINAFEPL